MATVIACRLAHHPETSCATTKLLRWNGLPTLSTNVQTYPWDGNLDQSMLYPRVPQTKFIIVDSLYRKLSSSATPVATNMN
eukprot:3791951-Amphidinium_carterae.1